MSSGSIAIDDWLCTNCNKHFFEASDDADLATCPHCGVDLLEEFEPELFARDYHDYQINVLTGEVEFI